MKRSTVSVDSLPLRSYHAKGIHPLRAGSSFIDHGDISHVIVSRGVSHTRNTITYDSDVVRLFKIEEISNEDFALHVRTICRRICLEDLTPECDVYRTIMPYFGIVIVIECWGNPGDRN